MSSRRSVSLGRQRERTSQDLMKGRDDDSSTRQNISNFLLTLKRVEASEEENKQLRKENQLLRQRARFSHVSTCNSDLGETVISPNVEEDIIASCVKRTSLLLGGDSLADSPALKTQYKKLQEELDTLKEFLKHLYQHALTLSSIEGKNTMDVNIFQPDQSKQLERSIDDIHGQIDQLRNSQDQQQIQMEQVQKVLENVLCQAAVRNDMTMRMLRQQDQMRAMSAHIAFLEAQLRTVTVSLRQAENNSHQTSVVAQNLKNLVIANSKQLKGKIKDELCSLGEQLSELGKFKPTCPCKMAVVEKLLSYVTDAVNQGKILTDCKLPADVIDAMSKLERLIGSDWHRLGRMLGLSADCLDDIGKFTNFDLTSQVEKVVASWIRQTRAASEHSLRQGLDKMDRNVLLIAEQPVSPEWCQLPPETLTFVITHATDTPSLVGQLCSQGVLSQDSRDFIMGATQEDKRASRLLHSIVFMGSQALQLLCTTLDSHKQTLVAHKIRGCLPSQASANVYQIAVSSTYDHPNRNPTHLSLSTAIEGTFISKSPTVTNPADKSRKKRSRSLFTRKNKLRDNEGDVHSAKGKQVGEYSYCSPPGNLFLNSSPANGIISSREEDEAVSSQALSKRQYGRQYPAQVLNSSHEVIV